MNQEGFLQQDKLFEDQLLFGPNEDEEKPARKGKSPQRKRGGASPTNSKRGRGAARVK